ncbi:MAG: GNAT family N-acetyltransferase [Eubacterium sp.]
MIKYTDNKEDIIKCWHEAFGDSNEEIEFFIDNVKDAECLAYYDGDKIASLLYLVGCKVNMAYSKYIYAACTLKEYRQCGYMSKLLKYAENRFKSICLIPAEQWLISYYSKRGFTIKICVDDIRFNQIPEIEEYLFEGCELENPFGLLNKGE